MTSTVSSKLLRSVQENLPSFSLIEDQLASSGHPLLFSFVKRKLSKSCRVTYVQYDCPRFAHTQILNEIGVQVISDFKEKNKLETDEHFPVDFCWLLDSINGKHLLVLDSLSSLLVSRSTNEVCVGLQRLEQRIRETNLDVAVVALLHSDVHDSVCVRNIRYVFPCILKVSPSSVSGKVTCNGVWKKPGGKVMEKEELFELDANFNLTRVEDASTKNVEKETINQKQTTKPAPSSTFRLGLTANEEKARSEVVLPFASKRNPGTGQIIYEAEDVDWDDEDPDDDLDI